MPRMVDLRSRGTRLARAEMTTSQTGIAATTADVTGLTIGPADGLTVGDRPVEIEAWFPALQQITSAGTVIVYITNSANTALSRLIFSLTAGSYAGGVAVVAPLAAGSGDQTVKVRASTTAGTLSVLAASDYRPYISAYVV